jgi:hypothetical protein
MLTTIMKYVVITALLAGIFWRVTPNLRSYLDFVVAAGAVFVLIQALNLRKYWWMAACVLTVCLFNPFWPIDFSSGTRMGMQLMVAALFAVSLQLLKTSPRLTIASIIEANPRTESL